MAGEQSEPKRKKLARAGFTTLPAVIDNAGPQARRRFVEFFVANIRNPNTRIAYARAVARFFAWCEEHHIALNKVEPILVAAYIEQHPGYAKSVRRKQGRLGDIWHVDELFVRIQGRQVYLWRAVDQDGDVLDILVTTRRDKRAAKRFFRKVLKKQGQSPWQLITDKLKTYPAAHREVFPSVEHKTGQYENNRAEVSHPTHPRTREADERVQINRAGSTIPFCPRSGSKFVPGGSEPSQGSSSATASRQSFCLLEGGDVCPLRRSKAGVYSGSGSSGQH